MKPARRRHPAFAPDLAFDCPAALREAAAELPAAPGVYVFHGDNGDSGELPLYIGKSVNLRARVLSHLRNADEARMLRQTRRISHIRTAGGIGALLLEARLIKQLHPLMNQQLRANRQLCSLRLPAGSPDAAPEVVYSNALDFAAEPDLFGLFASARAAHEALRAVADEERLCYGALGLDKPAPGRACFRAMLKQCAGWCCGDDSLAAHRLRLFTRLEPWRVARWPHPGAVGLVERHGGETQIHVVRHWAYLGSAPDLAQARQIDLGADPAAAAMAAAGFDADVYRILRKPLLDDALEIVTW